LTFITTIQYAPTSNRTCLRRSAFPTAVLVRTSARMEKSSRLQPICTVPTTVKVIFMLGRGHPVVFKVH
jgi:hypothetical protein